MVGGPPAWPPPPGGGRGRNAKREARFAGLQCTAPSSPLLTGTPCRAGAISRAKSRVCRTRTLTVALAAPLQFFFQTMQLALALLVAVSMPQPAASSNFGRPILLSSGSVDASMPRHAGLRSISNTSSATRRAAPLFEFLLVHFTDVMTSEHRQSVEQVSPPPRRDRLLSIQKRCGGCMPVAAHTRPGRRIAMAWSDRLAADLGSPVSPILAHILAWASTRPISTIEILDWVDPLSVSPRSATHRHCRRWLSAVWPKRIGSQSLRLSEFLGSGNQEAA